MTLLDILLVIFLPPIAVAMNRGVGLQLVLNILLTLIGWVPGVIHAAWAVSKTKTTHAATV